MTHPTPDSLAEIRREIDRIDEAMHLLLMERAPTVPGAMTDAVSAAAREAGMVIVLGVNERDHGSLYNTQLIFDADGALKLKRRKITPTYHERMIWGQGDGAGLAVVETAVGRVGALACWEHYNPLAMDPQLVRAHDKLDAAVDSAFGTKRSCKSEKERQEILFARYAELEARKQ